MDKHWIEAAAQSQRLVGVVMGSIAAEINPNEAAPMVRPAQVVEPANDPGIGENLWWLLVIVAPGLEPLPQMYREDEILGFWPE